jgi:hypothetical protein
MYYFAFVFVKRILGADSCSRCFCGNLMRAIPHALHLEHASEALYSVDQVGRIITELAATFIILQF